MPSLTTLGQYIFTPPFTPKLFKLSHNNVGPFHYDLESYFLKVNYSNKNGTKFFPNTINASFETDVLSLATLREFPGFFEPQISDLYPALKCVTDE